MHVRKLKQSKAKNFFLNISIIFHLKYEQISMIYV